MKEEFDNPYLAGVRSVPEWRMRIAFHNVGAAIEKERRQFHMFHITREVNRTTACTNQRRYTAIISSVDLGAEI